MGLIFQCYILIFSLWNEPFHVCIGETKIQVLLDGPTGYAELELQLMLERICNFLKILGFGIYIYVYISALKTPNTSFLKTRASVILIYVYKRKGRLEEINVSSWMGNCFEEVFWYIVADDDQEQLSLKALEFDTEVWNRRVLVFHDAPRAVVRRWKICLMTHYRRFWMHTMYKLSAGGKRSWYLVTDSVRINPCGGM